MVRFDVDAQQRGHPLVLLAGALRAAQRGPLHHPPEGGQQHGGDHHDHDLLVGQRDGVDVAPAQRDHLAQHRGHRLVARALGHLHQVRQEDRHADGGDQRGKPEGAAQGPVGEPLDGPGPERGEQHPQDQHDEQRDRQRAEAQHLRQHHQEDQPDEGGEHEHVAVREVDHADDAEHHRVADGDEAIDGAQRDAVDHLLDEIFHALVPSPESRRPEASRGRGAATTQEGGQNAVWLPNYPAARLGGR